jgi:hypothetical protein
VTPNPAWIEAPMCIAGFTPEIGEFVQRQVGKRKQGDVLIIVMATYRKNANGDEECIGTCEMKFDTNMENYKC